MRPYLYQFRELFLELNRGAADYAALLAVWALRNAAILVPHALFRDFNSLESPYTVKNEDLWSFYALSRVCDMLIEAFEPPVERAVEDKNRVGMCCGPVRGDLSLAQFVHFWAIIGILPRELGQYHPFWCEIAAIEAADSPDAPPQIEEVFWPALTFGNLLICRAGVRVRAGINVLNPAIAASSPLYFAYRRANRTAHDLSHGWGSNSQWRTAFRRDYVWREHYILNADGAPEVDEPPFLSRLTWNEVMQPPARRFYARNLDDDEDDLYALNLAQREELLLYRGFARTRTISDGGGNFWPYDDTLLLSMNSNFFPKPL